MRAFCSFLVLLLFITGPATFLMRFFTPSSQQRHLERSRQVSLPVISCKERPAGYFCHSDNQGVYSGHGNAPPPQLNVKLGGADVCLVIRRRELIKVV